MWRGSDLVDPHWLEARIDDTRRRWPAADARTAATLWWYSASSVLFALALDGVLSSGRGPDPELDALSGTVHPDGTLADIASSRRCAAPDDLSASLRRTLTAVVTALATVGEATEPALWAIASDSLGNRALDSGSGLGSASAGSALACTVAQLVGPALPAPRFVEVGGRRYLRRTSCCLIYLALGVDTDDPDAVAGAKCVSCPHQPPERRSARLAAL